MNRFWQIWCQTDRAVSALSITTTFVKIGSIDCNLWPIKNNYFSENILKFSSRILVPGLFVVEIRQLKRVFKDRSVTIRRLKHVFKERSVKIRRLKHVFKERSVKIRRITCF